MTTSVNNLITGMTIIGSIYTITIAILLIAMTVVFFKVKEKESRVKLEYLSSFTLEESILPENKSLYNKKIDNICWLGSSNPYRDQSKSLIDQLLYGVRCFSIDIYLVKKHLSLDLDGKTKASVFFNSVSEWLKMHPRSIITIIINSFMIIKEPIPGQAFTNKLRDIIEDSKLKTMCYKFKNSNIPTIGELLIFDKRLILISEHNLVPIATDSWINIKEVCVYSKPYSKGILGNIISNEDSMIGYIMNYPLESSKEELSKTKPDSKDWDKINISHSIAGAVFKFNVTTNKYPTYIICKHVDKGDAGGAKRVIRKINEGKLRVVVKS